MQRFSREFYLLTSLATMIFIASTVIRPFFSLYVVERGASPFELGLIMSLISYTTIVVRLPLGSLTGRVGSWWVVPLALFGQLIAYVLYSLVTAPIHFYPVRVFHAIALATLQPTLISLVSRLSPEGRRGEGVGTYLTSVGLAIICGTLLSSVLLRYLDYRSIFLAVAVIPCLVLGAYLYLLRRGVFRGRFSRDVDRVEGFFDSLKGVVRLRPVQVLTYVRFTFAFTEAAITTIYAVYAVNVLNLDPSLLALILTFRGLSDTLTRIPAGRLSDVVGRKIPLIVAFAFVAVSYFMLSEVKSAMMIGVAMIIFGAAHGTRAVTEWTFLGDVVPRERGTLANAYFSTVFDLGAAMGATFTGSAAMILPAPAIFKIAAVFVSTSVLVVAVAKPSS